MSTQIETEKRYETPPDGMSDVEWRTHVDLAASYKEDRTSLQLKAMAAVAGGTLKRPKPEIVLKTREQFESGASQGGADVLLPEWPAYLRLLDRLYPNWCSNQ